MKKAFVFLTLFSLTLQSTHVKWLGGYDKALKLAKELHKPLLVYLVKNDTPECNTILKDYLMNQEYVPLLNKKFISVIVTYEGQENYPIEMYYATSFPTLFFVDSQHETFISPPLSADDINQTTIKKALSDE